MSFVIFTCLLKTSCKTRMQRIFNNKKFKRQNKKLGVARVPIDKKMNKFQEFSAKLCIAS